MRIKELAERSGVTKRNIHFYVKEGLLAPDADGENGYYDFNEEDLGRLRLIRRLREADLSLPTIRSILRTPAATEYYLRMRLARIETERERLLRVEGHLTAVLSDLPIEPTAEEIHRAVVETPQPEEAGRRPYDGALVNHFLFRQFMRKIPSTEYRDFLWDKINRMTDAREKNADYVALYDFLALSDHARIDNLYARQSNHYDRVAQMDERAVAAYAETMRESLSRFCEAPLLIRQWQWDMKHYYRPMMNIYTGEIGRIAEEMCPLFKEYKTRSGRACEMTYAWLVSSAGEALLERLTACLGEDVSHIHDNHAALEAISMIFAAPWETSAATPRGDAP